MMGYLKNDKWTQKHFGDAKDHNHDYVTVNPFFC